MISSMIRQFKVRGFVGPRYSGVRGKLRILEQMLVRRIDVVLVATPETRRPLPAGALPLRLTFLDSFEEFAQFAGEFDRQYYPGFSERWRNSFEPHTRLAIAVLDGAPVGFSWVQKGGPEGPTCHYARLFPGEYRVFSVGVLPDWRQRGINTASYCLLLEKLCADGATRIYVDCARDNIASLKAQIRAGYRPIGEIEVRGMLLGSGFARWKDSNPSLSALDHQGSSDRG